MRIFKNVNVLNRMRKKKNPPQNVKYTLPINLLPALYQGHKNSME